MSQWSCSTSTLHNLIIVIICSTEWKIQTSKIKVQLLLLNSSSSAIQCPIQIRVRIYALAWKVLPILLLSLGPAKVGSTRVSYLGFPFTWQQYLLHHTKSSRVVKVFKMAFGVWSFGDFAVLCESGDLFPYWKVTPAYPLHWWLLKPF